MTGSARARAEAILGALDSFTWVLTNAHNHEHPDFKGYERAAQEDAASARVALGELLAELDARTATLDDAREALREVATHKDGEPFDISYPYFAAVSDIARAALARLDGGREHHEKER